MVISTHAMSVDIGHKIVDQRKGKIGYRANIKIQSTWIIKQGLHV